MLSKTDQSQNNHLEGYKQFTAVASEDQTKKDGYCCFFIICLLVLSQYTSITLSRKINFQINWGECAFLFHNH